MSASLQRQGQKAAQNEAVIETRPRTLPHAQPTLRIGQRSKRALHHGARNRQRGADQYPERQPAGRRMFKQDHRPLGADLLTAGPRVVRALPRGFGPPEAPDTRSDRSDVAPATPSMREITCCPTSGPPPRRHRCVRELHRRTAMAGQGPRLWRKAALLTLRQPWACASPKPRKAGVRSGRRIAPVSGPASARGLDCVIDLGLLAAWSPGNGPHQDKRLGIGQSGSLRHCRARSREPLRALKPPPAARSRLPPSVSLPAAIIRPPSIDRMKRTRGGVAVGSGNKPALAPAPASTSAAKAARRPLTTRRALRATTVIFSRTAFPHHTLRAR